MTGPGETGPATPGPGTPGPGVPGAGTSGPGTSGPGTSGGEHVARDQAGVLAVLRGLLALVTGRPKLGGIPADLPLFGTGVGLDSLTGTLLLRQVRAELGVDVAAEDLNLDSLASLAALAAFIAPRLPPP
ncbi:MAG TPA: acyl carrier protein [Streptosporangiaceae bacterium]|jgi:hypothetical protein